MAITQKQFAKKIECSKYTFGLDTPSVVSALRQLADDLERGDSMVQSAVTYRKVGVEDYPMSAVVLKLYENLEDMPPRIRETRELHSAESKFPVDIAKTGE